MNALWLFLCRPLYWGAWSVFDGLGAFDVIFDANCTIVYCTVYTFVRFLLLSHVLFSFFSRGHFNGACYVFATFVFLAGWPMGASDRLKLTINVFDKNLVCTLTTDCNITFIAISFPHSHVHHYVTTTAYTQRYIFIVIIWQQQQQKAAAMLIGQQWDRIRKRTTITKEINCKNERAGHAREIVELENGKVIEM